MITTPTTYEDLADLLATGDLADLAMTSPFAAYALGVLEAHRDVTTSLDAFGTAGAYEQGRAAAQSFADDLDKESRLAPRKVTVIGLFEGEPLHARVVAVPGREWDAACAVVAKEPPCDGKDFGGMMLAQFEGWSETVDACGYSWVQSETPYGVPAGTAAPADIRNPVPPAPPKPECMMGTKFFYWEGAPGPLVLPYGLVSPKVGNRPGRGPTHHQPVGEWYQAPGVMNHFAWIRHTAQGDTERLVRDSDVPFRVAYPHFFVARSGEAFRNAHHLRPARQDMGDYRCWRFPQESAFEKRVADLAEKLDAEGLGARFGVSGAIISYVVVRGGGEPRSRIPWARHQGLSVLMTRVVTEFRLPGAPGDSPESWQVAACAARTRGIWTLLADDQVEIGWPFNGSADDLIAFVRNLAQETQTIWDNYGLAVC